MIEDLDEVKAKNPTLIVTRILMIEGAGEMAGEEIREEIDVVAEDLRTMMTMRTTNEVLTEIEQNRSGARSTLTMRDRRNRNDFFSFNINI